jgi:hypothetical protein
MSAGARSTISWYDFEGSWAWADDNVAPGKLTVNGMHQVRAVRPLNLYPPPDFNSS